MALLIGQPITGRDIEQITSPWSPERFASMCDALAWAASGRQFPGLPSFTTRVNAKDGGIDAEWEVEIPDDDRHLPTPIAGPGWNVFQYKKRDLIAQDRRRVIANLKSSLVGAVSQLVRADKDGRHSDRYVLFVNVDLKHDDKAALKESILKGYDYQIKIHVEIVGATELAALLNNHPHLRAAYFEPLSFKTWEEAHRAHLNQKFIAADVELIGRETELSRLRSLVNDPRVRAIVLLGLHDIGKSRLALEATRHRPHDIVLALDPRSMDLSDYRSLCASRGEAICIVKDPEPDSVEPLVNETLSSSNLKLIITLPTPAKASVPSYGRDERVQSLHLQPLSEEEARKLLKATGHLDFEVEDWIIGHAGGIPGILLAAASLGHAIRRDLANFVEAVGQEFEKRIQSTLGHDALKCARLFSILTHVGISGAFEGELSSICKLFGDGWTPHQALLSFVDLERVGLGRRGGSFAEITLPILANHLAAQLLRGRRDAMVALFARLDDAGRMRFIKRLSEVRSEEVERFWDDVFASDGLLSDFQAALNNLHLLRLVAGTAPERVLRRLASGLRKSSRRERLALQGEQRRELVRTLEQLLVRATTGLGAMRLMWLLAEAENEGYRNNATGILAECFHPYHPLPLSLRNRLELLREFTSEKISTEGKLVAIRAIRVAMKPTSLFLVRYGAGLELSDSRPAYTHRDIYDYRRELVDLLFSLSMGEDELAAVALSELPQLTAELGIQARPGEALDRFRILIDWAFSGKAGLEVASLVSGLRLVQDALSTKLEAPDFPSDRLDEFREYIAELDYLRTELETASFATKLKRWAGKRAYKDDRTYGGSQRFEEELRKLSEEAVKDPSLLDANLIDWLLSRSSPKANIFFFFLGNCDRLLVFRERMEALAERLDGTNAFSSYWGGWVKRDRKAAEERLDRLASSNKVTGNAIILATSRFEASQLTINRIETQIYAGRVDPEYAGRVVLTSRWMRELTNEQFEQLLKAVAGETFRHAATAVEMLCTWLDFGRSLQGGLASFAWECLEHDPPIPASSDEWHFDELAERLAQDDPERGFKLLTRLIGKSEGDGNHWDPLDVAGGHQFWTTLHARDRHRLIGVLLNAARIDVLRCFHIALRLRELLDQEGDKELLLYFAKGNMANARIIAHWVTSAKSGFWPIAFELVRMYPHDEELLASLTTGIERRGILMKGTFSRFYDVRKQEIEQILHEPSTPIEVRAWLREVLSRLEQEISSQIIWEYDEDVNDLRRYVQDKGSAQRMWAIGRILKYAKWEDIKRLLTAEDIEEALPYIDLPEKKRKMLERAVEVWRYGK